MHDDDMFDPDFDPYETLRSHDGWLVQFAQHMEQLACAGAELARGVERQDKIIRHLTTVVNHQQQLILQLNERLSKVETK
jgi:hypothetical protein